MTNAVREPAHLPPGPYKETIMIISIFRALFLILVTISAINAQTSAFSYQGRLTDGANPANGNFQMQFKLFDALSGGAQQGSTLNDVSVAVADGVFSVKIDFGSAVFAGANRWIEVAVRRNSAESYVLLTPREQITSSPYSLRTLSAAVSDDSQKLGGFAAADYVRNSTVSGSFIQNTTVPQNANFNITGNGMIAGRLGIQSALDPNYLLSMSGGARVFSGSAAHYVAETVGGTNTWARFYMRSPARSWFIGTSQNFNGDQFYLWDENANLIRMSVTTGGLFGLNSTNPQAGLDIRGTGQQVQQRITDNTTNNTLVLQAGTGANMKITGYNYGTGTGVPLYLGVDGANTIMNTGGGNVGIGVPNPAAKLHVAGTTRTGVLQITSGSDLAENFEIERAETVKPGMLVAIDPANAGKLVIASGAYNTRVVGIISGANGLAAGMLLPDPKNAAGALPVALSGRAWVYADATKGPIHPGDMLTTSDIPGYAMHAKNSRRAAGAVIGKAMTELRSGTGLVLVFVTLQ